jgi:hypothetical protein
MKLYHGTNARYLDAILKDGLVPRGKSKGNWKHTITSNPNAIYLTTAYALYFAMNSLDPKKDEKMLVVEVDTAKLNFLNLAPDEDALEAYDRITKTYEAPADWSMAKRTKFFRDRLRKYTGLGQWDGSLKLMGNCCHLGPIPREALTRVAIIDPRKAQNVTWRAMDPSITPINYRLCGKNYRGLTKWVFGDDLGEDAPVERCSVEAAKELGWPEQMRWDYPLPESNEGIEVQNV